MSAIRRKSEFVFQSYHINRPTFLTLSAKSVIFQKTWGVKKFGSSHFLNEISHFHSHIFPLDVPSGFDSYSKTPTMLLRKANLSPEDFLKNTEPRHVTFPVGPALPIPSPVYDIISGSPLPPCNSFHSTAD
jgi:hypothetical protein